MPPVPWWMVDCPRVYGWWWTCRSIPSALVDGDAAQLGRLVRNLVRNAAEAMPTGGVVTVRVRVCRTTRRVSLVVADTGAA
jgi:signal transduction histidine kinase